MEVEPLAAFLYCSVRATMLAANIMLRSDPGLRWLFRRAAKGLSAESG